MRVIGVLDLVAGRAVHARAGDRAQYRPVQNLAGAPITPGDALALARRYIETCAVSELYIADLDAIQFQTPPHALTAAIAALAAPIWLDAGISSLAEAQRARDAGAAYAVVGLETLGSFDALADICAGLGRAAVAFSLDLRDRWPLGPAARGLPPESIAARAAAAGAATIIVLDLARVGTGAGPDFEVIQRVRETVPDVAIIAGGGVRRVADLVRLAESGCDGALVATALHDGSLSAADVTGLKAVRRGRDRP